MTKENQVDIQGICPCCHKHCPVEALSCPRGRRHFGMEEEESLKECFVSCAHILNHRKLKKQGQLRILEVLHEKGKMHQKELLSHFDIRSATLSELLHKLEEKEYIFRIKIEEDKRSYLITITQKGVEALKRNQEKNKDWFAALNEEEQAELAHLLKKLKTSWEDEEHHHHHHHGHHHHHEESK